MKKHLIVHYAFSKVEGETMGSLAITVGGLFELGRC
jgi:hypothetical protein